MQAVPQLALRLRVLRWAMKDLLALRGSTSKGPLAGQSLRDIRLVGRLFVSKASVKAGSSIIDQQQVDAAHSLGYSLYLHVL
jgi:hypothetical protein